ncbi:hypothetical protein AB0H43_13560 [Hamadaea sp. NPDC050747]|uniref:hypothetical protein n=1 Tax=Hamadaea sp. NPDC050747 TaxID=3155789 RepID=UPI0034019858
MPEGSDARWPRPLLDVDARAMIGVLAIVEGYLLADALPAVIVDRLRDRLAGLGLVTADADGRGVARALNDLNQRVRRIRGE